MNSTTIPKQADKVYLADLPLIASNIETAARRLQSSDMSKGVAFAVFHDFAKKCCFLNDDSLAHIWVRASKGAGKTAALQNPERDYGRLTHTFASCNGVDLRLLPGNEDDACDAARTLVKMAIREENVAEALLSAKEKFYSCMKHHTHVSIYESIWNSAVAKYGNKATSGPTTPPKASEATDTPPTTSTGLLGAAKAIQEQRAKDYDQPSGERSMGKTVAAFNAVTGRSGERALSEADGWLLMCLLKMVRDQVKGATPHRDSIEDLVSYTSLYGEARLAGGLCGFDKLAKEMSDRPFQSVLDRPETALIWPTVRAATPTADAS